MNIKIEHFKELLESAKKFKIQPREKTFFDTALRKHHENPTTELLAFFLDPNGYHGLGDSFYQGFIQTIRASNNDYENFNFGRLENLSREQITDEKKRIDLCVETQHALIIVEVKIGYEQNNPIVHYSEWATNYVQSKPKSIVQIVLNIDGKSDFSEWFGIPFQALVNQIRPLLAQKNLDIGLNKWIVFARDFLLHLDSFYEREKVNMEVIEFVVKNYAEIHNLFKVREQAYEEIKKHILKKLHQEFIDNEFSISNENRFKQLCRGWRFSCSNLDTDSDIVLYLNFDEKPIAEVWLCLELPARDKSVKYKLDSILKKSDTLFNNRISWSKSDEDFMKFSDYRSVCWEFNDFNLDEISQLIIYIQNIINRFDA